MKHDTDYMIAPTTFYNLGEARDLSQAIKNVLQERKLGTESLRWELYKLFDEVVSNAADHGMTPDGARAWVELVPRGRGRAVEWAVEDRGPGIWRTLGNNPNLEKFDNDTDAMSAAFRNQVSSSAGVPFAGLGMEIVRSGVRRLGGTLMVHSGSALFWMPENGESILTDTEHYAGTKVRIAIPI